MNRPGQFLAQEPSSQQRAAPIEELGKIAGPATAEAYFASGAALWNRGRAPEAIEMIDCALRARPDYPEALCLGGYILGEAGQVEAALRFYNRALRLKPDFVVALTNSGKLLFNLGRFAEALAAFEKATGLAPANADAWNSRAGALRELGRLEDSIAACAQALLLRPGFAEATLNLGTALMKLDRPEEALPRYRQASALRENFAPAFCGEGLALTALGRLEEALAAYDAAVRLGSVEAIGNRGCLLLSMGEFEPGWEGYESRWLAGRSLKDALGVRFPTWSGAFVAGQRLLVMNDHGLGDTIQFSRYAPLAAAAGLEVTLLCPRALHRLLGGFNGVRVVEAIDPSETFDAQIALSSLPRAFKTRIDSIPAASYLKAEEALSAKWAARIGAHGFKIGISWQGNPNPEADIGRSFPLAALAPVAALPNVRLISLQKGAGVEQLAALPSGMVVETLGADFDSGPDAFVDTAAAMAHCDLVITCDTSIAHLAGALGRPTWVALKKVAEWRWLRERDDSPWYPTMRLFRQRARGDWDELLARMAQAARPLSGEGARVARVPRLSIPTTPADLVDRLTLAELECERLPDEAGRAARDEFDALLAIQTNQNLAHPLLGEYAATLKSINARRREAAEAMRECEASEDFGPAFVHAARAALSCDDERAALKRRIDALFAGAPAPDAGG